MREATTILDLQNVTRTSGSVTAIHDISFQIHEGEIYGLIGPNGAGKSTIIKSIVGHMKPDSGSIEINHYNLFSEFQDAIDFVGAVVEYPAHYDNMSGWANLKLAANMYPEVSRERLKEVVELVGMENCIHLKVRKYTLEMRQRLALAQAILNYPHLLILDEPMNGLDPIGIRELCKLLKSLAQSGMSILIASHLMDETETLCDRVGILSHGYLLAQQDMHEFHDIQEKSLSIRVDDVKKAESVLKELFEQHVDIQLPAENEEKEGEIILTAVDLPARKINRALIENGIEVDQICVRKQTLEELYLKLTGGAVIE